MTTFFLLRLLLIFSPALPVGNGQMDGRAAERSFPAKCPRRHYMGHPTMRCQRWGGGAEVGGGHKGRARTLPLWPVVPYGLCTPHPRSIVALMKSRPQSLSIWPAWHRPVKGNRLAEQRHYITICRCRQARQRRDMAPEEREKGLWHPSFSHLG